MFKLSYRDFCCFLILFVWLFVCLSPGLFHYVAWFLSCFILTGFFLVRKNIKFSVSLTSFEFASSIFLFFFVITTINAEYVKYHSIFLIKIMIIVSSYYILFSVKKIEYFLMVALVLVAIINAMIFVLYSLNVLGGESVLNLATGRYQTQLTILGQQALIGVSTFGLGIGMMLQKRLCFILLGISIVLVSNCLVLFDGSRTALISMISVMLFLFLYLLKTNQVNGKTLLFMWLVLLFIEIVIFVSVFHHSRAGSFVVNLLSDHRLQHIDSTRYSMLIAGFKDAMENFFLGKGMGSTTIPVTQTLSYTPDPHRMSVHNVYLQLAGDLGVGGLLGYVYMIFIWVFHLPFVFGNIKMFTSPFERIICFNSCCILIVLAIYGMFNPMSSEWSFWAIYITGFVSFFRSVNLLKSRVITQL